MPAMADLPAKGSRYQPLVPVVVAVAAGIFVDRYRPLPIHAWWLATAAGLALWLLLWTLRRERWAFVALLLSAAVLAGAWHHCRWSLFRDDDVGHFARRAAQPVCLEAIATASARLIPARPPDPLESVAGGERTRVEVRALAVRDGLRWRSASGTAALAIEGLRDDIRAGDRLRVLADLRAASPAENPGAFDYALYLRADRRRVQLHAQQAEAVRVIDSGRIGLFARAIDAARRQGRQYLQRYLDPRHADLAAAILLGAREQLDPVQYLSFMKTGTVHLLVVSGLNVGILAAALWFVLRRLGLPKGVSLAAVAGAALAYMFLTDAEPPVVRATVLVLGSGVALVLGRRGQAFNSLAAAALVVLAVNPADLFNVGAQLSFLCVAGMVWLVPDWAEAAHQRALRRLVEESRSQAERVGIYVRELTILSVMLSALTAPLTLARFHLLSPIGPLVNVAVAMPIFTALLSGFALLAFGWLPPVAWLLGCCCNASLWLVETTVELARRLPGGHFWAPGPSDWWVAGLYALLALVAIWPRLRPNWRRPVSLLAGWSAVGLIVALVGAREPALECTFLSVGHGLAVVIRLPDGRTMLYDAGHLGPRGIATRAVADCLWSYGLRRVDMLVISHADSDHYNAVPDLLERFSVGEVHVSPVMFRQKNAAVEALRQAFVDHRIEPRVAKAGDVLCAGDCTVRVLHPPAGGLPARDNANSLVLGVEYRGRRILLPGDLEPPGLDNLIAQPGSPYEVLLAPHHGSRHSGGDVLAAWAGAKTLVITDSIRTGGAGWLPEQWTRLDVLHTALHGAVVIRIDGRGLTVAGYLDPPQSPGTSGRLAASNR